jgi:hypothetical protein
VSPHLWDRLIVKVEYRLPVACTLSSVRETANQVVPRSFISTKYAIVLQVSLGADEIKYGGTRLRHFD